MVIRHGGLTAEERIKKAVEVCKDRCSPYCPYWTEDECRTLILTDCAEAIAERDERIAIMQESMEELEQRELVQHGHWVLPDVCYEDIECSVCHAYMPLPISFDYRPTYKYCPMCGAKMDEVTT